ncbi:hypothetical protein AHF37_10844, partial [Paragonimus kellicotti]
VISRALAIWSLELVPFLRQSPEAVAAREHPENQNAFICNFRQHWFTIRKFGLQWFDLNSLMSKPRLISTTYLTIYLAQLQQEGNSIFIVIGTLPICEAEQVISDFRSSVDNSELEEAIRLSLTPDISPTIPSSSTVSTLPSAEEIRQRRQAFLNRIDQNTDKSC